MLLKLLTIKLKKTYIRSHSNLFYIKLISQQVVFLQSFPTTERQKVFSKLTVKFEIDERIGHVIERKQAVEEPKGDVNGGSGVLLYPMT